MHLPLMPTYMHERLDQDRHILVLRVGAACLALLRALPLPFAADGKGSRGWASVTGGAMGLADGVPESIAFASAIACIARESHKLVYCRHNSRCCS